MSKLAENANKRIMLVCSITLLALLVPIFVIEVELRNSLSGLAVNLIAGLLGVAIGCVIGLAFLLRYKSAS